MRVGMQGMRRRIADYGPDLGIAGEQALITVATLAIGWSVLIMLYNLISSLSSEEAAARNPWGSRSPEFQAPSPLPEFNYEAPITVIGEPYDYGMDDATYVVVPSASGD